jgi:hypothetical protein
MDHCAKHPLKLLLPDPARGDPATPRPFHLTVAEYFALEHGCMDAGGDPWIAAAPAQPSPGSKPFAFPSVANKIDVGSPGQLANRQHKQRTSALNQAA